MEFFAAGILVIITVVLAICALYLFYSILLYISAAIVNIENRTFSKALISTLLSTLISMAAGFLLGFIPFIGVIISMAAGFLIPVVITQSVFHTDFIKALLAELIRMVISAILAGICIFAVIALVGMEALQSHMADLSSVF